MRGQTDSARMGDTLRIKEDHVGPRLHLTKGREQSRGFPKAQQAWNIWETDRPARGPAFDQFECRQTEDDDAGMHPVAATIIGDIGSGNELNLLRQRLKKDPVSQPGLDRHGRVIPTRPAMKRFELHNRAIIPRLHFARYRDKMICSERASRRRGASEEIGIR